MLLRFFHILSSFGTHPLTSVFNLFSGPIRLFSPTFAPSRIIAFSPLLSKRSQRLAEVTERIGPGGLSRRQAARELAIGYATLKRLLDAELQPLGHGSSGCERNAYAEVLH